MTRVAWLGPRLGRSLVAIAMLTLPLAGGVTPAVAQGVSLPRITIDGGEVRTPQDVSTALQVLLVLTVLSLAPAILLMMTSFTRIVIVLSLLRQAIGIQQLPPNQVLIGLSLFLTMFVMAPVAQQIQKDAYEPYVAKKIGQPEAFNRAMTPLRTFMLRQTREPDLALMVQMANLRDVKRVADVPTHVVVPAFALSEIKSAFQMGVVLFVPFLVIDLVVASTLMSMGMMMLPPAMISLPFKLLLFVLADGWQLVIRALVTGYR